MASHQDTDDEQSRSEQRMLNEPNESNNDADHDDNIRSENIIIIDEENAEISSGHIGRLQTIFTRIISTIQKRFQSQIPDPTPKIDRLELVAAHSARLWAAFDDKNISQFGDLIESIQPDKISRRQDLSIFETCCKTPGRLVYIDKCLQVGFDVNQKNKKFNKAPIHYAVDSCHPVNIKVLLNEPTTDLNSFFENLTPLQRIVMQATNENANDIFQCLKVLVDKMADVNLYREPNVPVLKWILSNSQLEPGNKKLLAGYILISSMPDLDTYNDGEIRQMVLELSPALQLKARSEQRWTFEQLIKTLENSDEVEFRYGVGALRTENNSDMFSYKSVQGETIMSTAIKMGLVSAVALLLRLGADPNNGIVDLLNVECKRMASAAGDSETNPLMVACQYGRHKIVRLLLDCRNINVNLYPVLICIIQNMTPTGGDLFEVRQVIQDFGRSAMTLGVNPPVYSFRRNGNEDDFKVCFLMLVQHCNIDINQTDGSGTSALQMAATYNVKFAILELLKRGAYLGAENNHGEISICDITAEVLGEHFDKCIMDSNGLRPEDDDYKVEINYSNFDPFQMPAKCERNFLHVSEMSPIMYMARSLELKELVKHPVIASYLYLKWIRLSPMFYVNFGIFSIFFLSIATYLLLCFTSTCPRNLNWTLYLMSTIGIFYVCLRELVQILMSPQMYIKHYQNWLELLMICLTAAVIFVPDSRQLMYTTDTRRTLAALTILLVTFEQFELIGSLPILSFSAHLVMLKTIAKNLMKGLLIFAIILFGFAMSFHMLLGKMDDDEKVESEYNSFATLGIAMVKTMVMLSGELDGSSIDFQKNRTSYFVFGLFVFLISTVLFNLLTGLAISDIMEIKKEAEIMQVIYRAEILYRYENAVLNLAERLNVDEHKPAWLWKLIIDFPFTTSIFLFPNYLTNRQFWIVPNKRNRFSRLPASLTSWMPQFRPHLNASIIQNAEDILAKRKRAAVSSQYRVSSKGE